MDLDYYKELLSFQVAGNTLWQFLIAALVFIAVNVTLRLVKRFIVSRLSKFAEKTKTDIDNIAAEILKSIGEPFYALFSLFMAFQGLTLPKSLDLIVDGLFLVTIVSLVVRLVEGITTLIIQFQMKKNGKADAEVPSIIRMFIKIALWTIGFLMILSNLGINITSLVAGLGIGGLAISLALQNVLGDLFSSFSIAVDKPFEVGDYIVVGDHKGTVKHIGLKTTRLQALQGEELVMSNTELTTATLQNFKKMKKRRVAFTVGVTYETPHEKLKKVDEIIESAINSQDIAEFDRAHFVEFGDSNLKYDVVYYVNSQEYSDYVEAQQNINIAILEAFAKEGLEMAYPTRTVYMKQN